jgi:hypothetical protein
MRFEKSSEIDGLGNVKILKVSVNFDSQYLVGVLLTGSKLADENHLNDETGRVRIWKTKGFMEVTDPFPRSYNAGH